MKRLLLVLLIYVNAWAFAQETTRTPSAVSLVGLDFADRYFETVGDSESIPDNNVNALAQDAQGLIWIGTPDGLIRYDGYRFRRYMRNPKDATSLGGNRIRALALAGDGRLWIGTDADGVSIYNPKTELFTRLRNQPSDRKSLSHDTVRALAATPDGGMWVGTRAGLNYQAAGQEGFTRFPMRLGLDTQELDERVHALLLDTHGELTVGTANGLSRLAKHGGRFERLNSFNQKTLSFEGEIISSLYEVRDGRIVIGTTGQGSWLLNPQSGEISAIPKSVDGELAPASTLALAALQPSSGEIWLGSFGGLAILDAAQGSMLQQLRPDPSVTSSLAHAQIWAMLQDRSGYLWLGGYGGGLQRHDPSNAAIRVLHHSLMRPNGLSGASIGSILERSNGELWLGTRGEGPRRDGINVIERRSGTIRHLKPEPGNSDALGNGSVTSLAETADRAIWAGTQAGLFRFDPNTQKFRSFGEQSDLKNGNIRRLLAGKNGELWIGSNNGLYRWTARTDVIEAIKFVDGSALNVDINALTLTSEGRLWVGSGAGLHTVDANTSTLKNVRGLSAGGDADSTLGVLGLLLDSKQRLWVDTAEGLNLLLRFYVKSSEIIQAEFDPVSLKLGIGGEAFGANLLEDAHGRIWTQYFVLAADAKSVYELGKADGVEFGTTWYRSYTRTRDGLMWFGGSKGVLVVDPSKFQARRFEPPLIATEFKVAGQSRPISSLREGLVLQPGASNFSLEFAALDYAAPQRVQYRYQLQGFDTDWIATDAANRVASYTNLRPGNYTLQVRSTNRLGEMSPHQLKVDIRVLPAFWQTGWFLALAVLSGLGVVFAGYRWRVAHLNKEAIVLQNLVVERTSELALAHQQMQQTQQHIALQEKMAGLGTLTAGVAHEINNPTNFVHVAAQNLRVDIAEFQKFASELVNEDEAPEVLQAFTARFATLSGHVKTMLHGTERIKGIVKDLRAFTRTDQAEKTTARMSECLGSTINLVRSSWQDKIEFTSEFIDDPEIACWPALLNQVFMNLLVNGTQTITEKQKLDSTLHGRISIRMQIKGEQLQIDFSDNGLGMSPALQARILEPFFTTKSVGEGTGLGLSISYGIILQHTGELRIHSTPGSGSCFSVRLPCNS